jgi:DNA-binding IclR family transcriptional regulator
MSQNPEQLILNFLKKEYPKDFSIEEIADQTRIHRNTVSKYLLALQAGHKVKSSRTVGRAKMYVIVP